MEEERKNNQLFELISQHPKVTKLTGGFGGFFLLGLIGKMTGIIDEISLTDIINWFSNLILFVKTIPNIIWVIFLLGFFICIYKFINDVKKIILKFLEKSAGIVKNDPSVTKISIWKLNFTVQRKSEKEISDEKNDKSNSKIIDFPSQKRS